MIRYVSRYVSCIGSMYRRYVSYRIIDTIHKTRCYDFMFEVDMVLKVVTEIIICLGDIWLGLGFGSGLGLVLG